MKKLLALLLSATFYFTSCEKATTNQVPEIVTTIPKTVTEIITEETALTQKATFELTTEDSTFIDNEETTVTDAIVEDESIKNLNFTGLNDPNLLQYINDSVCSQLELNFDSEDYEI